MKERFHSSSPIMQVVMLMILGAVAFIILSMLTAVVMEAVFDSLPSSNIGLLSSEYPVQFMFIYFVPLQVGFMLIPGLIYQQLQKGETAHLIKGYSAPQQWWKNYLWSFLLFGCVFLLLPFLSELNHMITKFLGVYDNLAYQKEISDEQLLRLTGPNASQEAYVVALLLIGVLTGIAEELLFRGFLFKHMIKNTGKLGLSVIGSAIVFALLHFNYIQLIPLIAFGVVLALMYHISNSIWPGIIMHSANNMINVYWMRNDNFPSWMESMDWKITIPSILILTGLLYLKGFNLTSRT